MADSNSFFSPKDNITVAPDNKYSGIIQGDFSYILLCKCMLCVFLSEFPRHTTYLYFIEEPKISLSHTHYASLPNNGCVRFVLFVVSFTKAFVFQANNEGTCQTLCSLASFVGLLCLPVPHFGVSDQNWVK